MATSSDKDVQIALFQSIGLNKQKAEETLKNHDVTRLLEASINQVRMPWIAPFLILSNISLVGENVFSQ